MSALFEIVGEFQLLYEMAIEDEVDPELFNDTLEAITGELEAKGAGYVAVIEQLEMEAAKADLLAKKYSNLKKTRKNAIKRMKDRLLIAIDALGKTEIPAGDFTIKVKKNGGKQTMTVNYELVPDSWRRIVLEVDEEKIRKALESGEELAFAKLEERGRHIEIK